MSDDPLREIKVGIFGSSRSPGRGCVQFFADVMRWPVDALVTRLKTDAGEFEYHIAWLKGRAIGFASLEYTDGEQQLSAMVHPLESVVRVEVAGKLTDDDRSSPQAVTRSMTLHFAAGESLTLDPATFTEWTQRENVAPFIDAVLDRITNP
jgi:hypothetical protein